MTEPGAGRVECYSGHTYAQEPRAVVWQGCRSPVARIEGHWRTPEGPAFIVETDRGTRFELRYSELGDVWTIQPLSGLYLEPPGPVARDEGGFEPENHNSGDSEPQSP